MTAYAWPVPILLLLLQCSVPKERLPYYDTPDFTPLFDVKDRRHSSSIHQIAPFCFSDQHNQVISEQTLKGKIHVASFVFTHCVRICPRIVRNLQPVATSFASDSNVVFLSFSVMPWVDDVHRLKQYTHAQNIIQPNWHFLTGERRKIYDLARRSYFAEEKLGFNKDSTEFLHTEHLLLVDKDLRIRGIYNGTLALETEQLQKDIQTLLAE